MRPRRATQAPDWLTARPIAHRGLHNTSRGIVENSLHAAEAALERRYAIECDVQRSADGEAIVFHDVALERLTDATGPVADRTAAWLEATPYAAGRDRLCTLGSLLGFIAGRVPLVCEIKSRFDGDLTLAERVRAIVAAYAGPVAIKSFDPAVIAHLRRDPPCPLGIVAEASYDDPEWAALPSDFRRELAEVLHFTQTQPDFLSYRVGDLPHAIPYLCRSVIGRPVIAWTVRTPAQRLVASHWADQIVFEGIEP